MNSNDLDKFRQIAATIEATAANIVADMQAVANLRPSDVAGRPAYWVAQLIDITLQYGQHELSRAGRAIEPLLPAPTPPTERELNALAVIEARAAPPPNGRSRSRRGGPVNV